MGCIDKSLRLRHGGSGIANVGGADDAGGLSRGLHVMVYLETILVCFILPFLFLRLQEVRRDYVGFAFDFLLGFQMSSPFCLHDTSQKDGCRSPAMAYRSMGSQGSEHGQRISRIQVFPCFARIVGIDTSLRRIKHHEERLKYHEERLRYHRFDFYSSQSRCILLSSLCLAHCMSGRWWPRKRGIQGSKPP